MIHGYHASHQEGSSFGIPERRTIALRTLPSVSRLIRGALLNILWSTKSFGALVGGWDGKGGPGEPWTGREVDHRFATGADRAWTMGSQPVGKERAPAPIPEGYRSGPRRIMTS